MGYTRINWLRRVREFANRIKLTLVSGTTYDVEQIEGVVSQIGVPFSDTDMNRMDFALYLSHNTFTLTSTGTDAYTATITGITSLTELIGVPIKILANFANSGAATINFNSLGAKNITRDATAALVTGDIPLNAVVTIVYDGTQFQVVGLTSDALKVDKIGDTMTGALSATGRGGATTKAARNVLSFNSSVNTVGTLKIKLPANWTNSMMHIIIKGFDFGSVGSGTPDKGGWELHVGGLDEPTGGTWMTPFAFLTGGKAPFSSVRLGHDGTTPCILLGTTTTRWDYETVSIDFVNGYIGWNTLTTGWVASIIGSEAGITVSGTPALKGNGRYTQLIAITGPTSGNYVVPPGVSAIGAFLLSGGGGGAASDTSGFGGGGGAGGNCLVIPRLNVTEGQSIPYVVGGGGAGATIVGGAGGVGGTTSFNTIPIVGGNGAPGSQSGNPATGTANGGTGASAVAPAVAGTPSAGNSPNVGNIFRAAGLNSFTNEYAPAGGGGGATEQFATGRAGGAGAYGIGGAGGNTGLAGSAGGIGCGGGGGGRSAATRGLGGGGGAGMLVIYELR